MVAGDPLCGRRRPPDHHQRVGQPPQAPTPAAALPWPRVLLPDLATEPDPLRGGRPAVADPVGVPVARVAAAALLPRRPRPSRRPPSRSGRQGAARAAAARRARRRRHRRPVHRRQRRAARRPPPPLDGHDAAAGRAPRGRGRHGRGRDALPRGGPRGGAAAAAPPLPLEARCVGHRLLPRHATAATAAGGGRGAVDDAPAAFVGNNDDAATPVGRAVVPPAV